ncbi:g8167 [Coccomyxa elongata]
MLLHISGAVLYSLLSPEDTGQGWIFAGSVPESVESCAQIRSYAFNFVPAEGGKHCQLALQELYKIDPFTRTAAVNVRPAVAESTHHTAAQTSNGPNEACFPHRLQAHASTQGSQATMDWKVTRDVGLNNRPAVTDAEIKDAIRTYIADPEFHRYVDRLEQLWDSVEREMLQQADEGLEIDCSRRSPAVT